MFIKLCNLGRDAEVRFTSSGTAVTSFPCAYSIGYGDKKKTQWIDAVLWGERGQKMAQHLTKGTKILLTADDVELEQFQKRDGSQGAKIRCRVIDVEFAGSKQEQSQGQGGYGHHSAGYAPSQRPAPQPQPQQQQQPTQQNYTPDLDDNWDDDIPF